MRHERVVWLAALAVTLLSPSAAQVAILQIQFLEGEGAVHAPGSRSARPLTVEVTDETGRPVAGAAVSFHLPEDGPGGAFSNGLHTEIAITDAQGRVALHGLQVNRIPGRFQIRVVATKEQARAGVVSSQYIAESARGSASQRSAPAATAPAAHSHTRWIVVAAIVGGGAVGGVLSATRRAPPGAPAAAPVTAPPFSIGTPTSTVGKP